MVPVAMQAAPPAGSASRESSSRAVAEGTLALVGALCPGASPHSRESLMGYATAILGSMVGSGAGVSDLLWFFLM